MRAHTRSRRRLRGRGRKMDGEELFYPSRIRQNPPCQPTTFTLLATTAVAVPALRLPTFTILRCPKLPPGTPELRPGTRVCGWIEHGRVWSRGHERGGRCRDGRKFATGSLMSLKQKTPPLSLPHPRTPCASRYRTSSFLPSVLRTLVYFPCCPSSTFVKRRPSLNPTPLFPSILILPSRVLIVHLLSSLVLAALWRGCLPACLPDDDGDISCPSPCHKHSFVLLIFSIVTSPPLDCDLSGCAGVSSAFFPSVARGHPHRRSALYRRLLTDGSEIRE